MTRPARTPRPLTPDRLRRIALHHLDRYETTSAGLRRVLLRRVDKVVRAGLGEAGPLKVEVEKVVAACVEGKLIDDRRFTMDACERLRSRGASSRKIEAWLAAKGLPRELVKEVLLEADAPDANLEAAILLTRRRRIGTYRQGPADPDQLRKELGILARAGFSYDVARKALAAEA